MHHLNYSRWRQKTVERNIEDVYDDILYRNMAKKMDKEDLTLQMNSDPQLPLYNDFPTTTVNPRLSALL